MLRRWLIRGLLAIVLLLAVAFVWGWMALRASLPLYDGEVALAGLDAEARVTRDRMGVVTIEAGNRPDAVRALGFVHAQERFFEMDLSRRAGAGELSALVGAAALDIDRRRRVHRFRTRARATLASASAAERNVLRAYAEGVNAGLAALSARPFPYLLFRQAPEPWREEDSLLVVKAMFFDLQGGGQNRFELERARLAAALPREVFAFLTAPGSEWDAPIDGSLLAMAEPPTEEVIDLRLVDPELLPERPEVAAGDFARGSNGWAVSGALTAHGGALVANDMHLGHAVPNIWFRARLRHGDVDISGVTLPGVPGVVVGSNGRVAWAFTNAYGDFVDWVRLEVDPEDDGRYLTASGWQDLDSIEETLLVRGGRAEILIVQESLFGPVLAEGPDGAPLALMWTAHRPGAVDSALIALENATSIDDAIAVAQQAGMPAQNFVVGDAGGRIAWTIAGRLPQRPLLPALIRDSREPELLDPQWLDPAEYPLLREPGHERLWTANARVVGGTMHEAIGDGGLVLGSRATQIRDGLFARDRHDEASMRAIQLDDRAQFLARWRELLMLTLTGSDEPLLIEMHDLARDWSGHAAVDDAGYRLVRAFRLRVMSHVAAGFLAAARARDEDLDSLNQPQIEGAVWRLLEDRPPHLLSPAFESWQALLIESAREVAESFGGSPGGLAARTWGERNRAAIRHPISRGAPFLSRWLDMPRSPLPGDTHMPRVQGPSFGASQRMAVAPGREAEGYFHMPAGQSGHPLSPYYGAGHRDWVEGDPTPFLPGEAEHVLMLIPADR
ncbi:MAG TPA: penicillin acylase family protein [Xanthomonadaceae bacterium]|nr:penicillin acylase family protein [Xanthomonadaceae bacterium]